ncbi:MAG TPA: AAA family ATPase, partial [Ktedonobacteraceae bacterium]
ITRLQSLLAYLLLHRHAPQNRSHLAFLLWPDSTEAQAHTNLRKLLYQLRQALPDIDQFLCVDKQTLLWRPAQADAPWTLDIQEMERALAQAKQAELSQDLTTLRQALERVLHLYRGDLLPGCYEEWLLPERDRWHQLFLLAAERLIALLEQQREYDAALTAAQQLLRQDPLHEATYRLLMRLYALRGDRAAALRIYHACVTALERELGTEPSAVTQGVYETLMQSDLPSRTLTGSLTSRGTAPPLLGRRAEWRQLLDGWRKMAKGQPRIVILSGEAGIGKTRLAEEMEAWVSRQGLATVSAHCYAALGSLAYAPVTTWLRGDALQPAFSTLDPALLTEIARLVPEVLTSRPHLSHPSAMAEAWQRQHFFEALARAVLSAHQPLLLLLDDMQWCDHETLEWLQYLLRFDLHARILLLGTVRAEEILPGHPLREFLGALQRNDLVTEIALGPLTMEETTSLAEHILGRSLDTAMSTTLHSETEGNPLFVVEMARAGTLEQPGNTDPVARSSFPLFTQHSSTLPPSVQTVLATRLAQLSPLAHDVANVAAVIGRAFPFSVLARASGQSEEDVVQGLDELWQRRIVREQGVGAAETYDFSHDKLREIACAFLSPARQRLLHRRIAEAFEEISVNELDTVSGQIADHYECAGLPERAIPFYRRAGETALQVYANTDAIAAFQWAANLFEAGAMSFTALWEDVAGIYVG